MNKNYNFTITKESLEKNKFISNNMDGNTFHLNTHILYDIRTELGDGLKNYLEIGSYAGGSMSLISSHPFPTNCMNFSDLSNLSISSSTFILSDSFNGSMLLSILTCSSNTRIS
jgi:hypothetical protein